MTIEVTGPDGTTISFPDATAPETIKSVMAKHYGAPTPVDKPHGALGFLDDVMRSIASGATFGFADELAAKANELTGLGGSYEQNLAKERARDKAISPYLRIPGEIVGGALTGGAAVKRAPQAIAAGFSYLPQWARLAGTGAASGAAYGAGSAEGGLGDRADAAAQGALVGAPLGYLAPKVAQGAVRLGQEVRGVLQPRAQAQADLGRALLRDSDTAASIASRATAAAAERPGVATLADAGGENVRGLVERVAQTPGAGRTKVMPFLTQRQQEQATRISSDLTDLTGTSQTAREAIDTTIAARSAAARPLYDRAMAFDVTTAPSLQRAFQDATETGWGKAIIKSSAFRRTLQTEFGIDAANQPQRVLMPVIDAWKKQADDMISEALRSGNANKARVIRAMRDNVVAEADRVNPAYAEARKAWEGPSRFMDAVEQGRNILSSKISAEETAAHLASLSDSEREAFRIGAVSAIRGKFGNDPAKLADMTKYLRSPEVRAKIAAIMPTEEAAQKWAQRLNFEVGASELTGRSLGNSATARRLAERQDADGLVGDLVFDALTGTPTSSIWRRVIGATIGKGRDTLRSRSDRELANVLTDPNFGQQSLDRFLREAMRRGAPLSDTARGALATAGGMGGGF